MNQSRILSLLLLAAAPALAFGQVVQVDHDLYQYQPVVGVSGNINSVGSDTLENSACQHGGHGK
jgi:hypothetical protein